VGCSYYLAAMNNERKPLLSDEWIQAHEFVRFLQREERVTMEVGMRTMRTQYCRGCGNKIKR
jgi:hypothetical protein